MKPKNPPRDMRRLRRLVQTEAAGWGVLSSINNAFINPLLISRGAGPLALGIYNSGANLFGFGSGWVGPRLAARLGSVRRTTLICLTVARIVFLCLPLTLLATGSGNVGLLVALVLLWSKAEGLALPLWTSFLTGMVRNEERGRWLAMRATAATGASAIVMIGLAIVLRLTTRETALPFAYGLAAFAGFVSLTRLRALFVHAGEPPVPAARSVRSLPEGEDTRSFLRGVIFFWFGAGLVWPVLPAYIINELDAPTAYFASVAVLAAAAGVAVQRFWGKAGDERGARWMLLIGGIGASIVPALWAVIPVYWFGFGVELIASCCWPAHMMGLTLRSIELSKHEADRPNLLAWTSLAQGLGSFSSPLIASVLVGYTGTVPILFISAGLRLVGTYLIAAPQRSAAKRQDSSETDSPVGQ